ncbi:integrase catalytic domain-containing protein, partial [Proteus mirabilis]
MQIHNVGGPFQRISVDWTGPLPVTQRGHRFLLTVVDPFTKWCDAIPVKDTTTKTIARALIFGVFLQFGLPTEIKTDRGRCF